MKHTLLFIAHYYGATVGQRLLAITALVYLGYGLGALVLAAAPHTIAQAPGFDVRQAVMQTQLEQVRKDLDELRGQMRSNETDQGKVLIDIIQRVTSEESQAHTNGQLLIGLYVGLGVSLVSSWSLHRRIGK